MRGVGYLPLVLAVVSIADARPREWTRGLEDARTEAPAHGIVALEAPLPTRVRIPGGVFTMGSDAAAIARARALCLHEVYRGECTTSTQFEVEREAHEVTLSPYELDRTEVTVEAYDRCVSAGACAPPGYLRGDQRFDRPRLPVTYVRWEDAVNYCAWTGGRLPTEAEWEFAARGQAQHDFPWGDVYNPHLCNHGTSGPDETDATDGFAGLAPVGSFPEGRTRSGIDDLAGNVSEWVADFFLIDQETRTGYPPDAVTNPKGPTNTGEHIVRGGSYLRGAPYVRAAARMRERLPASAEVGFRCAADVRATVY